MIFQANRIGLFVCVVLKTNLAVTKSCICPNETFINASYWYLLRSVERQYPAKLQNQCLLNLPHFEERLVLTCRLARGKHKSICNGPRITINSSSPRSY